MLVLARGKDERIVIQNEDGTQLMEIAVLAIGRQVKLGIQAPNTLRIVRKEILQQQEVKQ